LLQGASAIAVVLFQSKDGIPALIARRLQDENFRQDTVLGQEARDGGS
jgi:hypothetical protein